MCVVKYFLYDCGHLRTGVSKIRCTDSTDKILGFPRSTSACPRLSTTQETVLGEACPNCERRDKLEQEKLARQRRHLDRLYKQNERDRSKLAKKWQVLAQEDDITRKSEDSIVPVSQIMASATVYATETRGEYSHGLSADFLNGENSREGFKQSEQVAFKTQQTVYLEAGVALSAQNSHLGRVSAIGDGQRHCFVTDNLQAAKERGDSWGEYNLAPENTTWADVYQHRENSLKSKTGSLRVNIGIGSKSQSLRYTKPQFSAFNPADATEAFEVGSEVHQRQKARPTDNKADYRLEDEMFVKEAKAQSDFFVDWTALQPRPSVVAAGSAPVPRNSISRRVSRIKSRLSGHPWSSPFEQTKPVSFESTTFDDGPSTRILRNDSLFLSESSDSAIKVDSFFQSLKGPAQVSRANSIGLIEEEPSISHTRMPVPFEGLPNVSAVSESLVPESFKPYRPAEVMDDRDSLPSRQQMDGRRGARRRLTQLAPRAPSDVSLQYANAMVEYSARASASGNDSRLPIRRKPVATSSPTPSWSLGDDRNGVSVGKARVTAFTPVDSKQVSVVNVMPRPPPKAVLPPKPKLETAPCAGTGRRVALGVQENRKTVSRLDQLFRADSITGERQATLQRNS